MEKRPIGLSSDIGSENDSAGIYHFYALMAILFGYTGHPTS